MSLHEISHGESAAAIDKPVRAAPVVDYALHRMLRRLVCHGTRNSS